jgi:hypothetical protein
MKQLNILINNIMEVHDSYRSQLSEVRLTASLVF